MTTTLTIPAYRGGGPAAGRAAAGCRSAHRPTSAPQATARPTIRRRSSAADRGGEIRFPRGTYRISRPVVIDLDRAGHTSIVADGTASLRMAGPGPARNWSVRTPARPARTRSRRMSGSGSGRR